MAPVQRVEQHRAERQHPPDPSGLLAQRSRLRLAPHAVSSDPSAQALAVEVMRRQAHFDGRPSPTHWWAN
jgi:hypothetical protein